MEDRKFLENTRNIIDELLRNSSHCFGINFERLNLTAVEINKRLDKIDEPKFDEAPKERTDVEQAEHDYQEDVMEGIERRNV